MNPWTPGFGAWGIPRNLRFGRFRIPWTPGFRTSPSPQISKFERLKEFRIHKFRDNQFSRTLRVGKASKVDDDERSVVVYESGLKKKNNRVWYVKKENREKTRVWCEEEQFGCAWGVIFEEWLFEEYIWYINSWTK